MPLVRESSGWTWDGKAVTEETVVVARDNQIDAWGKELAQLARDELGDGERVQAIEFPIGRIERFAARFMTRAQDIIVSAYVTAAGGIDRVTTAGWEKLAGLVVKQDGYGKGFIDALKRGEVSPAQAANRSRSYAGAATGAFEAGKTDQMGFAAPVQPGDACEGASACRCHWDIEEIEGRVVGTWIAVGDRNTCPWCAGNADQYIRWSSAT